MSLAAEGFVSLFLSSLFGIFALTQLEFHQKIQRLKASKQPKSADAT